MQGRSGRPLLAVAAVFAAINITGLAWIHRDLTRVPGETMRVRSASLQPDLDNPDRIRLTFDRAVVSEASVGRAEEGDVFRIVPRQPGRWVWSGRDTLDFLLDDPMPEGSLLRLAATSRLKEATGRTLEGSASFDLAARPLRLRSTEVVASDEGEVTVKVTFSQPVDPGEFLRRVGFHDAKTRARLGEPVCLTKGPQRDLVVRVRRPGSGAFKMRLDELLTGHGAEVGLGKPVEIERQVPQEFGLVTADADRPDVSDGASVRLVFSESLDRKQQLPRIAIEPPVEDLEVQTFDRTLRMTGGFVAGRRYTITVPATLLSAEGETLKADTSATVQVPEYEPEIRFDHREGILCPWGRLTVDARGVNIEHLELRTWRVHTNNLVSCLHDAQVDRTSQRLPDKTLAVRLPPNQPTALALDLREILGRPQGIYRIEAKAAQNHWRRDSIVVTVTDLAITAKRHRDGYWVWITSLQSGQPVSDVVVNGLTYNNQRVATARTDPNGIARLVFTASGPDGGIWVITASNRGDESYLVPSENQWMLDGPEQSGRAYASHYEAMIYTDRGVYRPGETIHLTGILRDTRGQIPGSFPLSAKVHRPDGRQVADMPMRSPDKGQAVFHADFTPSELDQTGPYRFLVTLPGSADPLGSTTAMVEAFVPVRMEVKASTARDRFGPNEPAAVQVAARYLWDQPASDLPMRLSGTLVPERFESKTHPDHQFGLGQREASIALPDVDARLDAEGRCQIDANVPRPLKAGLYTMRMAATVTEPGGRSVSSNLAPTLDLLDLHIGLRSEKGQVVPIGEPVSVDWVRLTGLDQSAAPGQMTAQLVRVEYDMVLKQVEGKYVWQSSEQIRAVGEDQVIPGAGDAGSFSIVCPGWGSYRVIVTDPATGSCTWLPLYASRGDGPQSMPMSQPERAEVVTDRQTYSPGDTAKVLVRSPVPGTVLLTLETDRVVAHRIARIEQNTCELEVPLPPGLRGSACLTATVVRAVDPNQETWLPHRALGTTRVLMDHAPRRLQVAVDAPAKALPGESISVTVDTGLPSDANRPTWVHVWAVDEGILLTADYQTPDPFAFFLGPRRPGVSTADLFNWLLPDYQRPSAMARIGGDEAELALLRRSPVPTRVRRPAVVWREAAAVDNQGKATIRMPLPDLTGQVRIMAVAVDHDRYGGAERPVTVTAPLLAEASWPRFAAPGDRFTVPVKLFNATDQPLTLAIRTQASGPVAVQAEPGDLTVQPGRPETRLVQVRATRVGPAEVTIEAAPRQAAEALTSARSAASLPIRAATALHTDVELKALDAGQPLRIEPSDLFMQGTVHTTVSVSARPSVELEAALEDQIRYPYGCVEQTSSRLLSMVHASRILDPGRAGAIGDLVKAGIARLWSMQTRSGGLSAWPGDASPDLWGTAYAAACLLEAKDAGYPIDPQFAGDLVKFLEGRLRATGDESPDIHTRALMCRVLAASGQPPHGWMARLAEQREQLDIASLAHLAQAFHAAGNKERALSLLPSSPPQKAVAATTAGRLTSQVQQEAVWLAAMLEIEPNHPMTAALAAGLNTARSKGRWGSTLNNAAVIAALSRYQAMTRGDPPEFTGTLESASGRAVSFSHEQPASLDLHDVAEPVQVSSQGRGTLYVSVLRRGLLQEGSIQPYQRQLSVVRTWTDPRGGPVDVNGLAVGDLVQVGITIKTTGQTVYNIAIVDALAGGMEVENPRLATSAQGLPSEEDAPDRVEFLDDRVVIFCTADSRPRTFRYALRAITAGDFALPPIQGSCMYDESVACVGEAARVTIVAR